MAGITELFENAEISDDVKNIIKKSWDEKITSIKEELRQEFSEKYKHDRVKIVEAVDSWVGDQMKKEVEDIIEEKKALAKDRVNFHKAMKVYDRFIMENLVKEVTEFRQERVNRERSMVKFADFISESLDTEIRELLVDKQDLAQKKYNLTIENKRKIAETKKRFIKEAAKKVEKFVNKSLHKQMIELKEDVTKANENDFGRKIFEAFASEYAISHMTEGKDYRKVQEINDKMKDTLEEAKNIIAEQRSAVSEMALKLKEADEHNYRRDKIQKMLEPFDKENRDALGDLLRDVKTERLDESFKLYLKSMKPGARNAAKSEKIAEKQHKELLREHTGDRKIVNESAHMQTEDDDKIVSFDRLRKLAGLKNN